ncbi:glycosyl hydrolase family 18 protein [Bacillus nakamurai]|uniref:glycosyl hydrolase family 18 protein n=1 Tax=Bacillus nakamurai TaxID=1793963 RepID=UPI0020C350E3|nr:glycosyl hydrolase family 18 protein [Bacillus nakamurai]MCP6681821.1 glycosyl hydrolase family 18 protein [Bacillus nakamurai]
MILAISLGIALALFFYSNTKAKAETMILGYTAGDTASYQSLTAYHGYLSGAAFDTFAFNKKGVILGKAPEQQLSFAKKKKIKTWAVISNYNDGIEDFDGAFASRIMTDKTARRTFLDGLVKLAEKHAFYGINIDFEAVNPRDRARYASLIKDISAILHKKNIKTMVSVPAKSADDQKDSWSWPYDYAKIGKTADVVQIMTYDEHGIWSEPGSVAGTKWIKSSLQFAVKTIKPSKVVMGIPAYGNDWDTANQANSRFMQWNAVKSLIKQKKAKPVYDQKTGSMTFTYQDSNGHKHAVWFENEKTIQAKAHFTKTYHIGGVSVYALGYESESFWKAIRAGTK